MYYEINVALNGQHLFATAERSGTNQQKAAELYDIFKEKFPVEEGYEISVIRWDLKGQPIEFVEE